jgi:hypothetical protein
MRSSKATWEPGLQEEQQRGLPFMVTCACVVNVRPIVRTASSRTRVPGSGVSAFCDQIRTSRAEFCRSFGTGSLEVVGCSSIGAICRDDRLVDLLSDIFLVEYEAHIKRTHAGHEVDVFLISKQQA